MKPLSILFLLVSSLGAQVKPTDAKVNMVFVGPFFTCSAGDGCPYLYRSAFQSWLNQCKKSPTLDVCRAEQVNTFSDDAKVVLFHCLNGEGRTCVLPLTEAEQTPESRELRETFTPVKAEPQKPVTPAAGIDAKPEHVEVALPKLCGPNHDEQCIAGGPFTSGSFHADNIVTVCTKDGQKDCVDVMCEGRNIGRGCPNYVWPVDPKITTLERENAELLQTISDQQKVITRLEKQQKSHSASTSGKK